MESFEKIRSTLPHGWATAFQQRHQLGAPPTFLAHYTSIDVLQKILVNGELWLSNPLVMNDTHELRHGMRNALHVVTNQTFGLPLEDQKPTGEAFWNVYSEMDGSSAMDVYYFCMSKYEHLAPGTLPRTTPPNQENQPFNDDGKLSMWRGYGGNGRGAAIIFKGDMLANLFPPCTMIGEVEYLDSVKEQERIDEIIDAFKSDAPNVVGPDRHQRLAQRLFNMFLLTSLFTKHAGFEEEQEWRAVYLGLDDLPRYEGIKHVELTARGLVPMVQMGKKVQFTDFKSTVHRIIAGPGLSNPLQLASFKRLVSRTMEVSEELVGCCSTPFQSR